MADDSQQSELRSLREALEQLTRRVEALEKAPDTVEWLEVHEPEVTQPEMLKAPVEGEAQLSQQFPAKSSSEAEPSASGPKISIPPPAFQLEPSGSGQRKQQPRFEDSFSFLGDKSLESIVGERWLTWLGAGSLVLAVAFFVPWAWQHFEFPAWLRVLVFHLAGLGILAGAHLLSRKQLPLLAQGLAGLGIFTLYAAAFAMHHHYRVGGELGSAITFVDCVLITAGAIAIALRSNSVAVVLLGALGGYLTPLIASTGKGEYAICFTYLAFLNVALLGCAMLRPWQFLKPVAVVATAAMFLGWIYGPLYDGSAIWGTEWLLVLHAFIFLVGTTWPPLGWKKTSESSDLLALAGNSLWFVGATWLLFHQRTEQQLALVCWGMALLHAVLFAWTYKRVTNIDRMPRVQLALAVVFFTLAVPLQLRDTLNYLAYAWAVEGFVFTAIAVYFCDQQMARAGITVLGLALGRALFFDFPAAPEMLGTSLVDRRFLVMLGSGLVTMAAGSCYWWVRQIAPPRQDPPLDQQAGGVLIGLGNIVALLGLVCQWDSRFVLVLWTLDAALVWGAAIYLGNSYARVYALLLSLLFVGGRALYHGDEVALPFQCVFNGRFGSLVLMALLYFVPAWFMRTRLVIDKQRTKEFEQGVPALLHVFGNAVLLTAITMEIHDWFRPVGGIFAKISTDEQVTYSVAWTIYAGVLVAVGFALKYRLPRMLGLLGFLIVAVKVFFIDLANLQLILRVLALAALGGMLLLTSFWYQKFSARLQDDDL
jgi:uncharacterized membrane protein